MHKKKSRHLGRDFFLGGGEEKVQYSRIKFQVGLPGALYLCVET